jgi:hypothetical protein
MPGYRGEQAATKENEGNASVQSDAPRVRLLPKPLSIHFTKPKFDSRWPSTHLKKFM